MKKVILLSYLAAFLLFCVFAVGLVIPSARGYTSWAMTPCFLALVGAVVLSKIERMRRLSAAAKAQWAEAKALKKEQARQ